MPQPVDEERGEEPLQPAVASVVAQGPAEHRRLDSRLDLADALAQSRRFAVHGILQSLDELLQMRKARLDRAQVILTRIAQGRRRGPVTHGGAAAKLPQPPDHPLTLGHNSGPTGSLRRGRARRIALTLLLSHRADHQRAFPDLLTDRRELLGPLLLRPLARGLHVLTARPGRRWRCLDIGLLPWPAQSRGRSKIRCVGARTSKVAVPPTISP